MILPTRDAISFPPFLDYLGELPFVGGSLAIGFGNIIDYCILSCLAMGMEPIYSQAFGAKQRKLLGLTLQRTVLLFSVSILISLFWLNMGPPPPLLPGPPYLRRRPFPPHICYPKPLSLLLLYHIRSTSSSRPSLSLLPTALPSPPPLPPSQLPHCRAFIVGYRRRCYLHGPHQPPHPPPFLLPLLLSRLPGLLGHSQHRLPSRLVNAISVNFRKT